MIYYGDRSYIRPIEYDDTEKIVKWRNRSFVRNNFIFQTRFTEEIHEAWMHDMVESGKAVQFIIVDKNTGTAIGSVYLRDIDEKNRKCEFGIFIGEEDYLGKGYGKDATKLILEHAFKVMKMHKVYLRVLKYNEQAFHSYLKSGFIVEGISKDDVWIDNKPIDVVFMAMMEV